MTYLSSPEVQAWWHQETGYVPITTAAYELSKTQGFYDSNPGTDTAIKQLSLNEPTAEFPRAAFRQFRAGARHHQRRDGSALERGAKPRKRRLDAAAERGNALLRKFERSANNDHRGKVRPGGHHRRVVEVHMTDNLTSDAETGPFSAVRCCPILLVAPQILITHGLFHLARQPGDLPVGPAGGCLWPVDGIRLVRQFPASVQATINTWRPSWRTMFFSFAVAVLSMSIGA